jgi:CHAD domain-containing protein
MAGTNKTAASGQLPGLVAEMRADLAVRIIMRYLLTVMQANEAGVHAGTDAECLHDFRIAVRRQRSLLGQIRSTIPQRIRQRLDNGFAWLGEITREARDLDVYLLDLMDDNNSLLAGFGQELDPLREFFRRRQLLAHRQLSASLESARYARLMTAWNAYLDTPPTVRSSLPDARRPVLALANQRIRRMLRRVIKQGKAVDTGSSPQDLHELRKSCKKLRYLMELFQSLYPVAGLREPVKALRGLQDSLGEYQDLQVQMGFLATFRQSVAPDTPTLQRALAATEALSRKLEKRQNKVRQALRLRFDAFAEEKYQRDFRRVFSADD